MTDTPVKLVPHPSVREEAKTQTIAILEDMLNLAKEGQIDCIMVIGSHTSKGQWFTNYTNFYNFSEALGQLEYFKHEVIERMKGAINESL